MIAPILLCSLISFSLAGQPDLDRAVDELDDDKVQTILQKNPGLLTQTEAIRLIDRLSQNRKRHAALFFGSSLLGNGLLGTIAGIISAKTFLSDSRDQDRPAIAGSIGIIIGCIGFVASAFFFPANKYRMLLTIFSGPLNKEQLKLLGVLQDSVIVHHR